MTAPRPAVTPTCQYSTRMPGLKGLMLGAGLIAFLFRFNLKENQYEICEW